MTKEKRARIAGGKNPAPAVALGRRSQSPKRRTAARASRVDAKLTSTPTRTRKAPWLQLTSTPRPRRRQAHVHADRTRLQNG